MKKDVDIGRQVSVIGTKIRHLFDASFAGCGITGTQALILHFIYMEGKYHDVFQRDIEAEFFIRRSSVTSVLNGLEKNDFLRRESVKEDARLKKIVLTDKSLEMLEHVKQTFDNINGIMFRNMKPQDIDDLKVMLTKIADNLP